MDLPAPNTLRPAVSESVAVESLPSILERRRLPALNGLRAVVILPVVIYHFGYAAPAGLSVTMFFVLSGFLITWLMLKEYEATETISLGSFYLRRTLRIFPAYYSFVGASIIADRLFAEPWTPAQIMVAATYTVNYYNAFAGHNATPAPHAWSLGVEEQFYLMWPLALLILLRRSRRTAALALTACILAAPVWRALLHLGRGAPAHYIYNAFDTRFDTLAIGCLIALLGNHPTFTAFAHTMARRAWYPLITLLALAASHVFSTTRYDYTVRFSIDSMLLGVLLLQLLQLHATTGWKWLDHRVIDYLGTISYPMYLWHAWGISLAEMADFLSKAARLPLAIGATAVLGAASYHMLERPVLAARPRVERAFAMLFARGNRPGARANVS